MLWIKQIWILSMILILLSKRFFGNCRNFFFSENHLVFLEMKRTGVMLNIRDGELYKKLQLENEVCTDIFTIFLI